MKIWFDRVIRSKTMLFGVALEILGVIQLNSDFLSTVLKPAQFGWLMLSIGIIVKILRMVTTQPLSDK